MPTLNAASIHHALASANTGPFGSTVHYLALSGSTNDILRDFAENSALHGSLVITDEQIAGRGRQGRSWEALPGTSLLMSLLFRPKLDAAEVNKLVMVCTLAIAEAAEEFITESVDIKWPNDLQIQGKKFAGILPESSLQQNQVNWVIVGMGINVTQLFPASHPLAETATYLLAHASENIDRLTLLTRIMEGINKWYARLHSPDLHRSWAERCVTIGQRVIAHSGSERIEGIALKTTVTGALIIQTPEGSQQEITSGEASLRPLDD